MQFVSSLQEEDITIAGLPLCPVIVTNTPIHYISILIIKQNYVTMTLSTDNRPKWGLPLLRVTSFHTKQMIRQSKNILLL